MIFGTFRRIGLVLVLVLLATGCGGGDDSAELEQRTTAEEATQTTAVDGEAGDDAAVGADGPSDAPTRPTDTDVKTGPAQGETTALLQDVTIQSFGTVERVVFEFTETVPAYQVRYAEEPLRQAGSGKEVDIEGTGVLEVRMEPASTVDLSEGYQPVYQGPTTVEPAETAAIEQVVLAGDFEGVMTWGVGTTGTPAFEVTTETGPPRLIVDVATG